MTHDDFAREPIPGLPAHLPEGEHIIWQGSPDRKTLALKLFHERGIAIYFAVIACWKFGTGMYDGESVARSLLVGASLLVGGALVIMMIRWFSQAIERTTIYTITNRRVVMRFGVALPVTFNFPFAQIDKADVARVTGDAGTIVLGLKEHTKISWAILWPHARPWRLSKPEPAMRMIDDVDRVASILGEQLHAYHNQEQRPASNSQAAPNATAGKVSKPFGQMQEQGA